MSKRRQIATKVEDLRKGDTVEFVGRRYNILRSIRETHGLYTIQLQIPGTPVRIFHDADPEFIFTRIGL